MTRAGQVRGVSLDGLVLKHGLVLAGIDFASGKFLGLRVSTNRRCVA